VKTLVSLVEKYKHVLENKKSYTHTWEEKNEAWSDITREFLTGFPNSNRILEQLKYEAIK